VKALQESILKLQKASETLSRLDVDPKHPWPALQQMNQIMDAKFWESLAEVYKHVGLPSSQEPEELKPRVKRRRKRRTEVVETASTSGTGFFPSTDVFQTDHLVILCCELPGFARDSLEVTLLDGQLVEVKGQIREHVYAPSCTSRERTYGSFCRRVKLPVAVNGKGIRSQYHDGLLELYFVRQDPGGTRQGQTLSNTQG
jgi:HSP20 family molecular chaperone IbpA